MAKKKKPKHERRWEIYACPECGGILPPFMAKNPGEGWECESGHPPTKAEFVVVVEETK